MNEIKTDQKLNVTNVILHFILNKGGDICNLKGLYSLFTKLKMQMK